MRSADIRVTDFNADFMTPDQLARLPFASIGSHVLIDTSAKLIGVENITIGNHVRIDAGVIIVASGPVVIGNRIHIGAYCYLEGKGGITLGDFANLSSYVSLHSVSDDFSGRSLTNPMTPESLKTLDIAPIELGRHAAVGAKSTLLPGVRLGEGAVVGAHSLVRASVEPWVVHAGVPARPIGQRSRELLALERQLEDDDE